MLMIHDDYLTYESEYIKENKKQIIKSLYDGIAFYDRIKNKDIVRHDDDYLKEVREFNITWDYWKYNIFSLTAGNEHMYNVYMEIRHAFRKYLENFANFELNSHCWWMESWVNCHDDNEILEKHFHDFPVHGYVSIEPHNTKTCFQEQFTNKLIYEINNISGLIYIGPGNRDHWVEKTGDEKFKSKRMTLGIDFQSIIDHIHLNNMSFIPMTL